MFLSRICFVQHDIFKGIVQVVGRKGEAGNENSLKKAENIFNKHIFAALPSSLENYVYT